ncbi:MULTISPECIES: flavohemoglobin expression-modulating QEGLA motif protein [unclassified Luteococcus]|uniref:flavohemoglobin expression-modulating QEGLA motif protein n=1 Tax=unclassified Luteococcus TaxID=2639923 RepID=UPI00313C0508
MSIAEQSALAPADRRVDEELARLAETFRFLLDLTPVDATQWRRRWLSGDTTEPVFSYRELSTDPDVALATLARIRPDEVSHPTVAALLANKHRELRLQAELLRARNTPEFLPLAVELFGPVTPELHQTAQEILDEVSAEPEPSDPVAAQEFHRLALAEIAWYREQDPDVVMHAELRDDVSGVLVSGDALLIGREAAVQRRRANALLQHEVGTHLVTQVNGTDQPLRCLGAGLAGYDETQEGLAVLAEVAVGELTRTRLRQLAGRVLTVDAMLGGASFGDAWQQLVSRGFKRGSAFTTVMRVYRSGGFPKDACYLRGLLDLLVHLEQGGSLELFFLGKFALTDLPLMEQLSAAGLLAPARITPRYLAEPDSRHRLERCPRSPLSSQVANPPSAGPATTPDHAEPNQHAATSTEEKK